MRILSNLKFQNFLIRIALVPRVLVDVSKVDCSSSVLGRHFDVPFYMTAVAMAKLYNVDGEGGA